MTNKLVAVFGWSWGSLFKHCNTKARWGDLSELELTSLDEASEETVGDSIRGRKASEGGAVSVEVNEELSRAGCSTSTMLGLLLVFS